MKYYLALGTNLGERFNNIRKAVGLIRKKGIVNRISDIYRTAPVGMEGNPPDFYNLCLEFDSPLPPETLIDELKLIEESMGRDTTGGHNLSRIIDIDIIFAENHTVSTDKITIPHKEMHNRLFVLIPLKDIAPDLIHPETGMNLNDMIGRLSKSSQNIRFEQNYTD